MNPMEQEEFMAEFMQYFKDHGQYENGKFIFTFSTLVIHLKKGSNLNASKKDKKNSAIV